MEAVKMQLILGNCCRFQQGRTRMKMVAESLFCLLTADWVGVRGLGRGCWKIQA